MNLGNKAIKDFKTQMQIEMTISQEDITLQPFQATQEGLQNDKLKTRHPIIMPTDLLPKQKRSQHYKSNIIRAIGYTKHLRTIGRRQHIQRKEMTTTHRV
jgi:hypothetical protein